MNRGKVLITTEVVALSLVSFTVFSHTTATDIVASKYVAYAMMGIIVNNPQFKKELAAAKAETRAALGLVSSN